MAVQHLLAQGRRRIATITGNLDDADGIDRLEGYKRAIQNAGLTVDQALITEGRFTRDWGYLCARTLLQRGTPIDAVFAGNDAIAMGAIQAFTEVGLRVPDDIAIIGFDDLPIATQNAPHLTTIRQPILQKGARATILLIDLIEGRGQQPTQILLPTQLVIRQSS
jgi:DNA-binding LacI/PurR family transcriptional regulator